jgi:hypothetical protein
MKYNIIKSFVFVFIILTSNFSNGQVIKFRKVIGSSEYDYGMSAKQTTDKGYIVGGSTSSFGNGNSDMYAVKTDSMGIPKFQNTFGGINIDRGTCIRQTSDNGYIIAGYTNSFGAGGYDIYLVKTDALLQTQWTKTYGGSDWDFGNCVEQTTDGGYIICGGTYSYGEGDEDYYLIKTNSIGDTLWTKTFGGTKEDIAKSVVQTTDGGYILTGTTKSLGDSLGDFYTIKTNSLGDTTWTNKYGGTLLDYGNDVLESRYGGYIVGGETQSFGLTNSDGVIVKLSPLGVVGSSLFTGVTGYDNIESITEDTLGRVAMTGRNVGSGDANGNGDVNIFIIKQNWSYYSGTTFGSNGYDIGYSIEPTVGNGFVICGHTNSFNNLLEDIYLIKTDSSGFCSSLENTFITDIETSSLSQNSEFNIFPNPAATTVTFSSGKLFDSAVIQIFDLIGNKIKSVKVNQNQIEPFSINISDLAEGLYILNLTTSTSSYSQKLVIQH